MGDLPAGAGVHGVLKKVLLGLKVRLCTVRPVYPTAFFFKRKATACWGQSPLFFFEGETLYSETGSIKTTMMKQQRFFFILAFVKRWAVPLGPVFFYSSGVHVGDTNGPTAGGEVGCGGLSIYPGKGWNSIWRYRLGRAKVAICFCQNGRLGNQIKYTLECSPARLVQSGRAHCQNGCELWASMTRVK